MKKLMAIGVIATIILTGCNKITEPNPTREFTYDFYIAAIQWIDSTNTNSPSPLKQVLSTLHLTVDSVVYEPLLGRDTLYSIQVNKTIGLNDIYDLNDTVNTPPLFSITFSPEDTINDRVSWDFHLFFKKIGHGGEWDTLDGYAVLNNGDTLKVLADYHIFEWMEHIDAEIPYVGLEPDTLGTNIVPFLITEAEIDSTNHILYLWGDTIAWMYDNGYPLLFKP